MDCLRSGRDWPLVPAVPVVLAGRGGGAGSEPRKSKPSSELFVLVVLGGAASAFGGGTLRLVVLGPAVLARGIGSSPPIKSI